MATNLPGDIDQALNPTLFLNGLYVLWKWQTYNVMHSYGVTQDTTIGQLTTVIGSISIVGDITNSTSNRVYAEVVTIYTSVRRNATVVHKVISSSITNDGLFFTDGRHDVIVHTFTAMHWRLETDNHC